MSRVLSLSQVRKKDGFFKSLPVFPLNEGLLLGSQGTDRFLAHFLRSSSQKRGGWQDRMEQVLTGLKRTSKRMVRKSAYERLVSRVPANAEFAWKLEDVLILSIFSIALWLQMVAVVVAVKFEKSWPGTSTCEAYYWKLDNWAHIPLFCKIVKYKIHCTKDFLL